MAKKKTSVKKKSVVAVKKGAKTKNTKAKASSSGKKASPRTSASSKKKAASAKKAVGRKKATPTKVTPKSSAKKRAVKKTPAPKRVAQKTASKKGTPKKTVAKKSAGAARKKKSAKAEVRTLPTPPRLPLSGRLGAGRITIPPRKTRKEKPLSAKELAEFRQLLLTLRDQVVDGIAFLSGDNLNRSARDASGDLSSYSLHMADQGTDNFDREFALNLVSSEQDILYEIDEAIRRVDAGTYGTCEMTGEPIERARLKVIPYARFSVTAQSEMERTRTRYRPFGPTLSHGG
jgi:DnaK suppressor protein